jgi:trehalose 6-phosphate synthase
MSESRVFLIASPVPADEYELEGDRTAQLIAAIRSALDARWTGWSSIPLRFTRPETSHGPTVSGLDLSAAEVTAIRDQVNTRMLWPVFHGRQDLMQFDADAYEIYLTANRRLAYALRPQLRDNDLVWVHDYLHGPLARGLRDEGFVGAIGFLLHAPFPSPSQLATLPAHKELLHELCCYDVLGFQTESCRTRFHDAVKRFLGGHGRDKSHDSVSGPLGKVETCVCEIPGNTRETARTAASAAVLRSESYLRKCSDGRELIGSFATLDQAQGLLERLRSFEALLELAPHRCSRVSMLQATLPRRQWIAEDDDLRVAVEQEFMRINGRFATLDWTPIRYFHRSLVTSRLTALYRSVRVGLITPLSEGVNLTAKDFVAAQSPVDPGVLVASNLAGGSNKLTGALYVNPYDAASVAATLNRALGIPLEERLARWLSMMDVLEAQGLEAWCSSFISRLKLPASGRSSVVAA